MLLRLKFGPPSVSMTTVRILSASYGPCTDDATHLVGCLPSYDNAGAILQLAKARDVLPFVRILLLVAARDFEMQQDEYDFGVAENCEPMTSRHTSFESSSSHRHAKEGNTVSLLWGDVKVPKNVNTLTLLEAGQSMNTIFGDPCVGATKKLSLNYIFIDETRHPFEGELSTCHFSEHESVILRRFIGHTHERDQPLETDIDSIKNDWPLDVQLMQGRDSSTPMELKRARSISSSSKKTIFNQSEHPKRTNFQPNRPLKTEQFSTNQSTQNRALRMLQTNLSVL